MNRVLRASAGTAFAFALLSCRALETDPSLTHSAGQRLERTEAVPDISVAPIPTVKAWAHDRLAEAETSFQKLDRPREQSPTFWGKEIVYSIQVDRFNDGDPANNDAPPTESQYGQIPEARHGGDLKGITDRLDYLADLGITALWLTPVFKHRGSYHGYCATDPTDVDPGFGTREDLRNLVFEAHKRGIKVVLDIVVNHLCDAHAKYTAQPDHARCAADLNNANWNGGDASSPAQGTLSFGSTFFPAFRRPEFFNRCGTNGWNDTSGQGPETMFGDFSDGMFDYNTKNTDFQAIFTDIHKWWIAYADVDGYRLDAAKHVTEDYLAYFSTHIRAYAQSLGKKNFYIVGEVAASPDWIARRVGNMLTDPENPASHGQVPATLTYSIGQLQSLYLKNSVARYPGMNAAYDFILSGDSRAYLLQQAGGGQVRWDFQSPDHDMLAMQGDRRLSWVVLEIHDWPRFTFQNPTDPWKSKLGLSYLATVEGMPVIYYGLEQGFTGICDKSSLRAAGGNAAILSLCGGDNDALKRQDMFMSGPWRLGSTIPEIQKLAYIGPSQSSLRFGWRDDPMLARDHDVYQTSRRFNHLRQSCSPLNQGRTVFRYESNDGILAYSRIDGDREMVVVVNNTSGSLPLPDLDIEAKGSGARRFRNAVNEGQTAQADGGRLKFQGATLDGNSVAVFADETMLRPYDASLKARLCL